MKKYFWKLYYKVFPTKRYIDEISSPKSGVIVEYARTRGLKIINFKLPKE